MNCLDRVPPILGLVEDRRKPAVQKPKLQQVHHFIRRARTKHRHPDRKLQAPRTQPPAQTLALQQKLFQAQGLQIHSIGVIHGTSIPGARLAASSSSSTSPNLVKLWFQNGNRSIRSRQERRGDN